MSMHAHQLDDGPVSASPPAGRLAGPASTINLDDLCHRHLTAHGVSFGFTRNHEMAAVIAGLLPTIVPAVSKGVIRPVTDRTFALTDADSAFARLSSGDAIGKVVFTLT